MKASEIWDALDPYMTIQGLNKTWTYVLTTTNFMMPIEEVYIKDSSLAIKLRSLTIFYDLDKEFDATIEVSKVKLRLGHRVPGIKDFPRLPNETDAPGVLSYHDVEVYCGNTRYRIADNYAYTLHCNRCGAWSFWFIWQGKEQKLGEEYGNMPFCITVAGRPIIGTIPLGES